MSIMSENVKLAMLWLVLALIWSTSYLAIKVGVSEVAPLNLVAIRMMIGSVLLLAVMVFSGAKLSFDRGSLIVYLVSGVMGSALPFALISIGELQVESSLSALLMGIAPVATVLLAPLVHPDEKLTFGMVMGIVAGALGLVVLFFPAVLNGAQGSLLGQTAIVGAALCYAFTTLFVRKYASLPALSMAAGSMIVGSILVFVTSFLSGELAKFTFPNSIAMSAVVYLGIFPTAMATLIYFYLVPKIGAARISQVNFAVPVFGGLFGVVLLREDLTPNMIVGLVFILGAVYLVSKK